MNVFQLIRVLQEIDDKSLQVGLVSGDGLVIIQDAKIDKVDTMAPQGTALVGDNEVVTYDRVSVPLVLLEGEDVS